MSRGTERRPESRRQHGFALLLTVFALILAGTSFFLSVATHPSGVETQKVVDRAHAAEIARAALFGYSVAGGGGTPGALPCPDLDNNGRIGTETNGNIACQASADVWIGRLPHRSLGVARADMPGGHALWYALDADFLDWQTEVNPGTEPTLEIEGETRRFPAVLILPGDPVREAGGDSPQERPSTRSEDYLEGINVQAPESRFASCDTDRCNDTVIGVSAESLLAIVRRRAVVEIGQALRAYRNSNDESLPYLPWAAEMSNLDDPPECVNDHWSGLLPGEEDSDSEAWVLCDGDVDLPAWIAENGWNRYVFYTVAEGCRDSAAACVSAPDDELLTLDNKDGQAVIFGVPEDMDDIDTGATSFSNPDDDRSDRFHAIPASED